MRASIVVAAYDEGDRLWKTVESCVATSAFVQQGSNGIPIMLRQYQYGSQSAAGATVYPVTLETAYRNDDGTGAVQTAYAYTYYPGTVAVQQRTTTYPVVSAAQNGSGVAATRKEYFDQLGNLVWEMGPRGFIMYQSFDPVTGGLLRRIDDFNTSIGGQPTPPAGWTTPAGGGLNLITDFTVDSLGREIQRLGPAHTISLSGVAPVTRAATWTVYQDSTLSGAASEVWIGQGYATGSAPNYTFTLVNPVSITRYNDDRQVTDQIAAIRDDTSGPLVPTDSFAQSSYCRWTNNLYDGNSGQLTAIRVYFLIPASGSGAEGTNYHEIDVAYDGMGRRNRVLNGGKTITRTVYDARNLTLSLWVGTNDTGATDNDPSNGGTPPNNMVAVVINQYDGGTGGGDGNLTSQSKPVNGDSADDRDTAFGYDWRNRQVRVTAAQDWYQVNTFDTMNRVTQAERYSQATNNLISRNQTLYDDRGQAYQTVVYGVDPNTGTVGNSLVSNKWFDASSNAIMSLPAGSKAFVKSTYDGAGRQTVQYVGYYLGTIDYNEATSVANDTIMEQVEMAYDGASNVVQTTTRQRFHNATGIGPLTQPGGAQPQARVTYVAMYPDGTGREQARADYGTNGDVTLTRPDVAPASSATVLVTLTLYNSRGEAYQSVDPAGTIALTTWDDASRRIQLVENYKTASSSSSSGGGGPPGYDENRTTNWTWTADDQIAAITAVNVRTGNQTTTFGYGTTLGASDVARNDVLSSVTYADGGVVSYLVNRQSEVKQLSDQNGTEHAYTLDLLGRRTVDAITTLGTGIDATVQRIGTTYEVRGNIENVTSFSSPTVGQGTVVNDVQRVYNSFEQLTAEYQEHNGAVNLSTSVNVQYQYANGSANTVRPTAIVYPNGRVLNLSYGTLGGMDDALSRIASLIDNDGSTHLADYTRLGLATIVQVNSPQPQIAWSLVNGTGADPYTGLDQFNRVVDNRWYSTATSADLDRILHGYDLASNRVWRKNTVAAAAGVYLDEFYEYDGLYRLAYLQRGQLNSTNTGIVPGTQTFTQQWVLDPTGNWAQFVQQDSSGTLNQLRAANTMNEITEVSPPWVTPAYDAAGNMTAMPQPGTPSVADDGVYDAWNRLISIASGGSSIASNVYDALNRRATKTAGGTMRHYYYTSVWQDIEERVASSTTADRQFVWSLRYIDDLILRDRGSERLYVLRDPNWNVTATCGSNGVVRERYSFAAYGQPTFRDAGFAVLSASAVDWETLFAGYRFDAQSGLYYIRRRFFHAATGTWCSRDPLGTASGVNLYEYVGSIPTSLADPSGLQASRSSWVNLDDATMNKSTQVAYGEFTVKVQKKDTGGFDGFDAVVTFTPSDTNFGALNKGQKRCKQCTEIQMIQIVRTRAERGGKLSTPFAFTPKERKQRGDIQVPIKGGTGGWWIDRDYGTDTSIFWNASGNTVTSTGTVGSTGASGGATVPAVLKDTPGFLYGGPGESFRWQFVTCAYCNGGAMKGMWFGCVTWEVQISVKQGMFDFLNSYQFWSQRPMGLNSPPAHFNAAVTLHQKQYPDNSLP